MTRILEDFGRGVKLWWASRRARNLGGSDGGVPACRCAGAPSETAKGLAIEGRTREGEGGWGEGRCAVCEREGGEAAAADEGFALPPQQTAPAVTGICRTFEAH
eukprot:6180462-Pleurochrysis_carterae.AAC.1